MKAVQILGPRTSPKVTLNPSHPLPSQPEAHPGAVLIRVHSASITAPEVTWPELYDTAARIPGHDISGTVAALPPSYAGPLAVGQPVYGMLRADAPQGGQADYAHATRPAAEVARKPAGLTHAQASALPIPALTAWEMLGAGRAGPLPRGARLLVTGASGAVGMMLVQLAKRAVPEARVIALASAERLAYLRELGVDELVDYATPDWEVGLRRGVDAVLDTVGGEVLRRSWSAVKDDGVVVTVADPPPEWALNKGVVPAELGGRPGVRYVYFVVSPDRDVLEKVADLIDEGAVKPLPVVEFPVDRAVEAWEFAGQRSRRGKAVINFVAT
ncbi:Reticulon-4-interacting protein 1, mitochondrial [Madurella mycetomatis]|uniref:Reticulon-4-interacting protein 1, mitochondrial n=1 Tax=Madurella mycetomatis TaxID=100816 RepID=A0A175W243_9PEZI|nr:Reticulon-4-interacting protein 1, mitochondrial [Madurella mycetomatis]